MASKIEEIIVRNHDDADEVSPVSEITEERRFRWVKSIDARLEDNYSMVLSTADYLTLSKSKQRLQYISHHFGFCFGFILSFIFRNEPGLISEDRKRGLENKFHIGNWTDFFFFPLSCAAEPSSNFRIFFKKSNSLICVKPTKGKVIIARTGNGVKE